ncbi:hypothetical protein [Paraliobacillus zengyii]|uniref:hypothetical protein n=1 Tax=Paraliobacillus zengyii TaxID=2213194 RepID=UPI000DD338F7|nr:hypothetical protein [Paraliobacillus zengyii]
MEFGNTLLAVVLGVITFIIVQGVLTMFLHPGDGNNGGMSYLIKGIALGLCLMVALMVFRKGN